MCYIARYALMQSFDKTNHRASGRFAGANKSSGPLVESNENSSSGTRLPLCLTYTPVLV